MIRLLKKGIRNPNEVPPYIFYKIRNKILKYNLQIKYGDSCIFQDEFPKNFENCSRISKEVISPLFDEISLNQSDPQYKNFKTYLSLPHFAKYFQCGSILEIGAGLSTGIWSQYSKNTGATITSIDANDENIRKYYEGTRYMKEIKQNVDIHYGMTVTPESLLNFYEAPRTELTGIPISDFESELDLFCRFKVTYRDSIDTIADLAGRDDFSMSDVIVSNGDLYFPKEYVQMYIQQSDIKKHSEILAQNRKTGILDNLINSNDGWDLVWFDSGEVSSIIEWEILNSHVNNGGLAVFHDIFTPKSMKNFVVAASILKHPDWEVLCIDSRTPQGLMIAQKTDSSASYVAE